MALLSDLKHAWRGILRDRTGSLVIVAILGVALGASVTITAVVEAILLRPISASEQEHVRVLWETDVEGERPLVEVSLPNFVDWRVRARSFESMSAMASIDWSLVVMTDAEPRSVGFRAVSASFFETLGVNALHGRTFLPEDDAPDSERVMVVSHGFWQRQLGGDREAIGRPLSFEDARGPVTFTVVGVLPPSFRFPLGTELFVPAGRQLAEIVRRVGMNEREQRGLGLFLVLGRLAPGVSDETARAELETIVAALGREHFGQASGLEVTPLAEFIYGNVRTSLWLLSGAVAVLLVIACSNVSALLLARMLSRRRSLWVRRALGARVSDLMRLSLVESLLLAGAGGALGLASSLWAVGCVSVIAPASVPGLDDIRVDASVVTFTLLLTLATGLVASIAPLSGLSRLRPGGATAPGTGAGVLATLEIGGAVVLLVAAALFSESLRALQNEDLGFRPQSVLTASVSPAASRYTKLERRAFYQQFLARAREIPGVTHAGAVQVAPLKLGAVGQDAAIRLPGQSDEAIQANPAVNYHQATPDYFRAMGIELLEGRAFEESESTPVALVSENLARRLWPGESATGKRIGTRDPEGWLTVIGVVANARYRELYRARFELYVHYLQTEAVTGGLTLALDAGPNADPSTLIGPLISALHELDPQQPLDDVATMDDVVARELTPWRFNAWMAGLFAATAALIAITGVFTLLARNVVVRLAEFAIRMAVGATGRDVVLIVLARAVRWTALGLLLGLPAAAALSRALESLLFAVSATDSRVYGLVAAGVFVACLAASLLPAWRASSVQPASLLRDG